MDGNLEYMCEGCYRSDTENYRCGIYETPPSLWARQQCCPHNRKEKTLTAKQRAGQQKGRRGKRRR